MFSVLKIDMLAEYHLLRRLRMVLRAYIEERGAIDTDMLFVTVEEQPISGRSIQSMLKHTVILPEFSKEVVVSPHAFRRTFCRLKVEAGTNIFVLQRLTGHSSLEILKTLCKQIYGKDLEEAIEKGFEGI